MTIVFEITGLTARQVKKSGIYRQYTYLAIGWRRREKRVRQILLEESGDVIYVDIIPKKNQEKEVWNPKAQIKIDHKHTTAPKARKRDDAKTTKN